MGQSELGTGDVRRAFKEAGFEVIESGSPQQIEVRKNNCAARLEPRPDGSWSPIGPPYFVVRGVPCELEDRGYQKFWYSNGKRFPIRKGDLESLHRFDEEARAIVGLQSLYNESLGSTSARTVYDRVHGRPDGSGISQ